MHRLFLLTIATGMLAALPATTLASGTSEDVLFVDADGFDAGLCNNPARPCRTIGFALQRLGKGGEIRVGPGQYELESAEDLLAMVSGLARIEGGYDAIGGFLEKGDATSVIVGAPENSRELLRKSGFHVISDAKSTRSGRLAEAEDMLTAQQALSASIAAAPCAGGTAAGLTFSIVVFLCHFG